MVYWAFINNKVEEKMTKKRGGRGEGDRSGEAKKGDEEYKKGEKLLISAQKKISEGKVEKAREDLISACDRFSAAVGQRGFFPEALYSWGEALKLIAEMDNDADLVEEAVEKYMGSGLQFIVDGRFLEKPFVEAQELRSNDKTHKMVFVLYILAIQVIKGKKLNINEVALLKDIRTFLTSPEIILTFIDTLLREKKERQSIKEEDELIAIATKILINVIIEREAEKPESRGGEAGEDDNPDKLN